MYGFLISKWVGQNKLIELFCPPTYCAKKPVNNELCPMDTIQITVIDREGAPHVLDAPTDMAMSIMELCKACELPVEGTCGGMALCASCHVYVKTDHVLSEPTDDELAMLDSAFFVQANSRLGCQLKIKEDMQGLELELAPVGN